MKRVKPIQKQEGRLKPALIIGAVAAITGGAFLFTATQRSSRDLEAEMARLKASGAKITAEDFKPKTQSTGPLEPASYGSIKQDPYPAKDIPANAADIYNKYVDQNEDLKKEFSDVYHPVRQKNFSEWTPEEIDMIRKALDANRGVIDDIIKASFAELCDYELDLELGPDLLLPHLGEMRHFARLLSADALIANHDGNPERALELCGYILNIANHLEDEPVLISQLVRIASTNIATDTIHQLYSEGDFSDESIRNLNSRLEQSLNQGGFTISFEGERYLGIDIFADIAEREFAADELWNAVNSQGHSAFSGGLRPVAYVYGSPLGSWWRNKDELVYIKMMNDLVDISKMPYYEALSELEKWKTRLNELEVECIGPDALSRFLPLPSSYPVTKVILPALGKALAHQARHEVRVNQAMTASHLKRYRQNYGSYPASLEALVPSYMSSLPIDSFSGNPMLYRPEGSGFVLYSVSKNLIDDNANDDYYDGDIVWRMGK
ncbi:hypothetical protein ACFL1X_02715 [Candidatus Hydrogenedentota bacterium]